MITPGYRSPLGRMLPTAMNVEEVKRRGYREDGIVVIDLNNDRLDAIEREIVKQWAERRYPKQSRMGEGK